MGKRELLIIVIFAAVIAVAYELTAPPAKEGEGFSLSRFLRSARREMQGNQPLAQHTATGLIPIKAHVTDLRVASVPRGVQVIGETRDDIAWELVVESSGPDQPTALEYAKRTTVKPDDLGTSLALNVSYPHEATQWTALTLHVPARLSVQVLGPGTGGVRAENLAALKLDRVTGIATAERIAGEVTGVLTGNELTVVGAGAVNLTLSSSRARFSKISRGVTLNLRRGRCEVSGSQGPVAIEESEAEVLINDHAGPIKTTGGGGRITIENPRQSVNVEVRSAPVTVTLREAVPVSVFANGERVRLLLDGTPIVTLDVATTGRIDATDLGLTPEAPGPDQEQRLTHAFGKSNAPRVTLRNSRGDIVIGKRK